MKTRSMILRTIGAGIVSAAFFLPSFAATRTVPSASYPNIIAAYTACNNGDIISITSSQSTAGFTIGKPITIKNGSANPTVSIHLSSGIIIAVNDVKFDGLKIYGRNSSTARCVQVNANVSGFNIYSSIITKYPGGSTGYAVYDLGSNYTSFYGVKLNGTNVGVYVENAKGMQAHMAGNEFTNPSKNVYSKRANGYTGDIGMWLEGVAFYAGSSTNAVCFHAYNNLSSNIPWYWLEGCSFQAYGAGAKCTKSETTDAMNAINLQACSQINCP